MMALVQKDYKKLLSYHAVSQVGYMVLGIGTAVPAGIIGGIFHMVNNALYKSCLFLTAGSVEKQAGTTDLEKLGGLARKMPLTCACFIVTACAISGVWPLNGFFSKELVFDGALERGLAFYLVAVAGSFFTAASFLKLGHAAFFGKRSQENENVREAGLGMLLPMLVIAAICVIFGVFNGFPLAKLIQPILGAVRLQGASYAHASVNIKLAGISVAVLLLALMNHAYGVALKKSGLHALDHLRYAPVISRIYDLAERGFFDPYNAGIRLAGFISRLSFTLDSKINWFYDVLAVRISLSVTERLKRLHSGNLSVYLSWSLLGLAAMVIVLAMKAI
jgi:NADH-quinone oxidoreductase subunit L